MGERLGPEQRETIGKFDLQQTDRTGILLQVEKGAEVEMSKPDIEKFHLHARAFAAADFGIKDLDVGKQKSRLELIEIAKSHKGLRGLASKLENIRVTITGKEKITWDLTVLRKALGIRYPAFVSEPYEASINIPQGARTATGKLIDGEKIGKAFRQALSRMKLNEEDINAILRAGVSPFVDTEALEKAIEEGLVLPPEARTVVDIIWTVAALPLQKES